MDLSIFLAQLFGFYFIIVGAMLLIRKGILRELINELKKNHPLMVLIALFQISAGLALVLTHSIFTPDYRAVISIIGYWTVLEGIFYILMPRKSLKKFLGWFDTKFWYWVGGGFSILFGLYLACNGLGWSM